MDIWYQLWQGLVPAEGEWHAPADPRNGVREGFWWVMGVDSPDAARLERRILALGTEMGRDGKLLRHRRAGDWREEFPTPRFHTWLGDWAGEALDTALPWADMAHPRRARCRICLGRTLPPRLPVPLDRGTGWGNPS